MTIAHDGLPENVTEVFGPEARAERAYDLLTVDVPPGAWISALETARTELACTYFDWLSAVDEPGTGFLVSAHIVSLEGRTVRRLLVRTTVPHSAPALPTAVDVFAGAAWHERETHEMFGIDFTGHPHLAPLLLPDTFEGHPLRKDFVLAARVAKAWPGAKEPGESEHGGPKRRQMLPPGVPDPNEWGPLKGQLPAAPARPARAPRTAGAAPATDRPARRTRTAGEGSASQAEGAAPVRRTRTAGEGSASQAEGAAPVRRTRTAGEGSASQAEGAAPVRRTRTAGEGSASQAESAAPVRRSRSASEGSASQAAPGETSAAPDTPEAAPARPPRRNRTASEGSASQTVPTSPDTPALPADPVAPDAADPLAPDAGSPLGRRGRPPGAERAGKGAAPGGAEPPVTPRPAPDAAAPPAAPRSAPGPASPPRPPATSDAPWHHARPAFETPDPGPGPGTEPGPAAEGAAPDSPPDTDAPKSRNAPDHTPDDHTPDTPAGGDPA
ncbi:NADH-quinone oxidoreductase subunit C [Streptomyces cremeus]|uniref:NADH-quinone oxidoreductase subunit C n=1 Tax=Streptomyces cremeus TaxID=66881 RepID=A0ABV5PGC7_STRCM